MSNTSNIIFGGDYFPGWQPHHSLFERIKLYSSNSKISYQERTQLIYQPSNFLHALLEPYYHLNAKSCALFPLEKLSSFLLKGDISCLNLETSLSFEGSSIVGKKYNLQCAPYFVEGLINSGIRTVSLANNHILDFGSESLNDTISLLDKYKIGYSGISYDKSTSHQIPHIIESNGIIFGFLSYLDYSIVDPTPEHFLKYDKSPFTLNVEEIVDDILKAKSEVDIIILNLHWGDEWSHCENENQRIIAQKLIDIGANAIVGHHSHTIQGFEIYKSAIIAYSLGNLYMSLPGISGIRTQKSLLLEINFDKKGIESYQFHSIRNNRKGQPELIECINIEDLNLTPPFQNKIQSNYLTEYDFSKISVNFITDKISTSAKKAKRINYNRIYFDEGLKCQDGFVALGKEFCGHNLLSCLICYSGSFSEIEIKFEKEANSLQYLRFGYPDWVIQLTGYPLVEISIYDDNELKYTKIMPLDEGYHNIDDSTTRNFINPRIKLSAKTSGFVCMLRYEKNNWEKTFS